MQPYFYEADLFQNDFQIFAYRAGGEARALARGWQGGDGTRRGCPVHRICKAEAPRVRIVFVSHSPCIRPVRGEDDTRSGEYD